ncbi:hypothetical protein K440DRAFT_639164 [Wilcoxina mikolae CBS 423.85]|nr:hypothetical protein K440DRAFT_639164 [Wilcoxina mikolae CBS 423.85]
MARSDSRWNTPIILITFLLQLLSSLIICSLSSSMITATTPDVSLLLIITCLFPIIAGVLTIISTVVHTGCVFTSSLHPLVVLTISIEMFILWLGVTIYLGVAYSYGAYGIFEDVITTYCSGYYSICRRAWVVFSMALFLTAQFIWLIVYAVLMRKRSNNLAQQKPTAVDPEVAAAEAPGKYDGTGGVAVIETPGGLRGADGIELVEAPSGRQSAGWVV